MELFDREGAEAWHTTDVAALLPKDAACADCGGKVFRKETDILDVWFDSGVSWFAVCESDAELKGAYLYGVSGRKGDGGVFIWRAAISIAGGSTLHC